MDTHGHERVAKVAGIPLLEAAFSKKSEALQAFYLGNWLTDVSQFVDPVSRACNLNALDERLSSAIDKSIASLFRDGGGHSGKPQGLWKSIGHFIEPYANEAKESIICDLHAFMGMQGQGQDSPLASFMRDAFFVIGYFKFVHPDRPGGKDRLDFITFKKVFDGEAKGKDQPGSYTQYYPHEHLDRPELSPCKGNYAGRPTAGLASETRSPRRREKQNPDVYPYIRDAVEMAAGMIAEVDDQISKFLDEKPEDNDVGWNQSLAKLGHALHIVEDFFAHSNWTELALETLGPALLNQRLDSAHRGGTKYDLRLRVYEGEKEQPKAKSQKKPGKENWVVTGYFDSIDAFFSLGHAAEEMFGFNPSDHVAKAHKLKSDLTIDEVRKFLREVMQLLSDPAKALDDPENDVARDLRKKHGRDVENLFRAPVLESTARKLLQETSLFRDLSPGARQELFETTLRVIIEGSRVVSIGNISFRLFELLQNVAEFAANPVLWVFRRFIPEALSELISDAVSFYSRDLFHEHLGGYRIGCHTLMAKDHEGGFLYEEQFHCATGLHWYIVKTLLRDSKKPSERKPIDWLELLENFLRNPQAQKGESSATLSRVVRHTITEGQQLKAANPKYSLEALFRKTAVNSGQFSWRTIADANFATRNLPLEQARRVINETLRARAWGVPVRAPNYAFKPGTVILIPDQIVTVPVARASKSHEAWFTEIIRELEWRKLPEFEHYNSFPKYQDYLREQASGVHKPISISPEEHMELILKGDGLRQKAINSYTPSEDVPSAEAMNKRCYERTTWRDDIEKKIYVVREGANKKQKDLLERLVFGRRALQSLYPDAASALDHYLRGTGALVRIPDDFRDYVRKRSLQYHKDGFMSRIQGPRPGSFPAAAARLALDTLTKNGVVEPTSEWPTTYLFKDRPFVFKRGKPDDTESIFEQAVTKSSAAWIVTYLNAEIASRLSLRALRRSEMKYRFEVVSWDFWVVDNYDWDSNPHVFGADSVWEDFKALVDHDLEGRKRFGGVVGELVGLPSNHEMRSLVSLLGAKPYSRSSLAWLADEIPEPWEFEFTSSQQVEKIAKERAKIEARRRVDRAEERARGALPTPREYSE